MVDCEVSRSETKLEGSLRYHIHGNNRVKMSSVLIP